jgi:hypothetical protein
MKAFKKIPLPRQRKAILVIIGVSLLAGLFVICQRQAPNEPVYAGHPLSYWLHRLPVTLTGSSTGSSHSWLEASHAHHMGLSYGPASPADLEEAKHAIQELGTNSLPYLVFVINHTDSRIKSQSFSLFQTLGVKVPACLVPAATPNRGQAVTAIRILGTKAEGATDAFRQLQNVSNPEVSAAAKVILDGLNNKAGESWLSPNSDERFDVTF